LLVQLLPVEEQGTPGGPAGSVDLGYLGVVELAGQL